MEKIATSPGSRDLSVAFAEVSERLYGAAVTQRVPECLNCSAPTPEAYCPRCGQKNADYRESLHELVGEVAQELFQLDSRIGRTVVPFLFQPGKLSEEWAAGRRQRYSAPLRIFLLTSVAYFFVASFSSPSVVQLDLGPALPKATADAGAHEGWLEHHARLHMAELRSLPKDEQGRRVHSTMMSVGSKSVFVVLPIFALLLMALFRRPRRYYVEHLVFVTHFCSFLFLLMIGSYLWLLAMPVLAAIGVVYLVVAARRFYRPTAWYLVARAPVLVLGFVCIAALALAAVAILGIMLA